MWQSYLNGLLVAFGLIMAIGTQNAFVLAQSLRREHHLPVAAFCVVCDALLAAGMAVLFSGLQSTLDERIRQGALLRALGALANALVQGGLQAGKQHRHPRRDRKSVV